MIKKRAGRNKTISLSSKEEIALARQALKFGPQKKIADLNNKIVWQDTFYALRYLPDNFVDLMVVDPPYNLTKNFGNRTFKQMQNDEYCKWLDKWLSKVKRVLKPNGKRAERREITGKTALKIFGFLPIPKTINLIWMR